MTAYINTVAEAHEEENRALALLHSVKNTEKKMIKERLAGNSFDRYRSDRDYQPGEI